MPAAAATHSRAAVAQPLQDASVPHIVPSYSPNELYGAFTRSATSSAPMASPSASAHTSAPVSGSAFANSARTSSMPHSAPARAARNCIVTFGL